ncbi:MAG: phosphoribosyltransferase [SAR86 cluster bacterium]|uniref:Phosphoribosyltransferase n=1 Tax=SAR86 cluster bacterium TaxID=2030880 RepID=A0A2A4XGJ7_9GAMM|nr:MAG: phosphoribosyltransferase [SAR86 cluster bacterium]
MFCKLIQSIRCALPSTCIVCGQAADRDHSICNDCGYELPKLGDCCRRCGIELNGGLSKRSCCTSCQLSPPSFDFCTAVFPYDSPIDKLIADYKFSARFDIGYSLSRVLASKFNTYYIGMAKPELLLPVPLHKSRLGSRGFNQASEMCNVLSKYCGVSISNSVLTKIRNTEPQASMSSAAARKANLRKAFAVSRLDDLEGVTHIALIDDVVTTMATTEAISRMLLEKQDCRIDVWCLARTL